MTADVETRILAVCDHCTATYQASETWSVHFLCPRCRFRGHVEAVAADCPACTGVDLEVAHA